MTLDNYFLLKEVTEKTGNEKHYYVKNFKDKIIVLRHLRYISKCCIPYSQRGKLTELYNHIPLSEFVENINLDRRAIEQRIDFMEKHNVTIFNYNIVNNVIFIVVDDELKHYLKHYTPFVMYTNKDYSDCDIKFVKCFADYLIGFY